MARYRPPAISSAAASAAGMPQRGPYQPRPRRPSNTTTKLNRYSASGSTQRNGAEATFCSSWLVVASSRTTPSAESPSQVAAPAGASARRWLRPPVAARRPPAPAARRGGTARRTTRRPPRTTGRPRSRRSPGRATPAAARPRTERRPARAASPGSRARTCDRRRARRNGARSTPAAAAPWRTSRKYGRPIVASRTSRIASAASCPPTGLSAAAGTMGSTSTLASSSATCSCDWRRGASRRVIRCA